jgi:hypothetical protein
LLILLDTVAAPLPSIGRACFYRYAASRRARVLRIGRTTPLSRKLSEDLCLFAVSLRPPAPRLDSPSAARASMPFKQYKITPGDWRNLEKWDGYRIAVGDMADWTLVEAEV